MYSGYYLVTIYMYLHVSAFILPIPWVFFTTCLILFLVFRYQMCTINNFSTTNFDGTSMPHNNNVRTEYLAVLALYTLYFIHGAHARNYATKATQRRLVFQPPSTVNCLSTLMAIIHIVLSTIFEYKHVNICFIMCIFWSDTSQNFLLEA